MFEQELTYQKLQIPSLEIYEAMGYKDSMPDGMVIEEINTLLDRTTPLLRPRFFFSSPMDCSTPKSNIDSKRYGSLNR